MAGVTIREAAAMAGVSERTLRRRIREGVLPATRADRDGRSVWMIDPGDLSAWSATTGREVDTAGQCRLTAGGLVQDKPRHRAGTGPKQVDTAGQSEVDRLQAQVDRLTEQVRGLEEERDWLRGLCEGLTRALPAPADAIAVPNDSGAAGTVPNGNPEPPRRRWWWWWW